MEAVKANPIRIKRKVKLILEPEEVVAIIPESVVVVKKNEEAKVVLVLTTENVADFILENKGAKAKDIAKKFGTTKHLVNTSHGEYLGLYKNPYIVKPDSNDNMWFHKSHIECKTCEMCGEYDEEEVGIATGENGVECKVCKYCDLSGSNYNGWGDLE